MELNKRYKKFFKNKEEFNEYLREINPRQIWKDSFSKEYPKTLKECEEIIAGFDKWIKKRKRQDNKKDEYKVIMAGNMMVAQGWECKRCGVVRVYNQKECSCC